MRKVEIRSDSKIVILRDFEKMICTPFTGKASKRGTYQNRFCRITPQSLLDI